MNIILHLIIFWFIAFLVKGEIEDCGEHERYTNCASSSCFEESCVDVLFPIPGPKKCTKDCIQGCQCTPDYFRNQDGRCVDELTCIMCGYGEYWVEDEEKNELSCYDLNLMKPLNDSGGSMEPFPFLGCHCGKDLLRTDDGLCVTAEACRSCGINEIYETCGSSSCWEYTCEDVAIPLRERLMRPCTLDCRKGCKCHPGFYRHKSGECVSAGMC